MTTRKKTVIIKCASLRNRKCVVRCRIRNGKCVVPAQANILARKTATKKRVAKKRVAKKSIKKRVIRRVAKTTVKTIQKRPTNKPVPVPIKPVPTPRQQLRNVLVKVPPTEAPTTIRRIPVPVPDDTNTGPAKFVNAVIDTLLTPFKTQPVREPEQRIPIRYEPQSTIRLEHVPLKTDTRTLSFAALRNTEPDVGIPSLNGNVLANGKKTPGPSPIHKVIKQEIPSPSPVKKLSPKDIVQPISIPSKTVSPIKKESPSPVTRLSPKDTAPVPDDTNTGLAALVNPAINIISSILSSSKTPGNIPPIKDTTAKTSPSPITKMSPKDVIQPISILSKNISPIKDTTTKTSPSPITKMSPKDVIQPISIPSKNISPIKDTTTKTSPSPITKMSPKDVIQPMSIPSKTVSPIKVISAKTSPSPVKKSPSTDVVHPISIPSQIKVITAKKSPITKSSPPKTLVQPAYVPDDTNTGLAAVVNTVISIITPSSSVEKAIRVTERMPIRPAPDHAPLSIITPDKRPARSARRPTRRLPINAETQIPINLDVRPQAHKSASSIPVREPSPKDAVLTTPDDTNTGLAAVVNPIINTVFSILTPSKSPVEKAIEVQPVQGRALLSSITPHKRPMQSARRLPTRRARGPVEPQIPINLEPIIPVREPSPQVQSKSVSPIVRELSPQVQSKPVSPIPVREPDAMKQYTGMTVVPKKNPYDPVRLRVTFAGYRRPVVMTIGDVYNDRQITNFDDIVRDLVHSGIREFSQVIDVRGAGVDTEYVIEFAGREPEVVSINDLHEISSKVTNTVQMAEAMYSHVLTPDTARILNALLPERTFTYVKKLPDSRFDVTWSDSSVSALSLQQIDGMRDRISNFKDLKQSILEQGIRYVRVNDIERRDRVLYYNVTFEGMAPKWLTYNKLLKLSENITNWSDLQTDVIAGIKTKKSIPLTMEELASEQTHEIVSSVNTKLPSGIYSVVLILGHTDAGGVRMYDVALKFALKSKPELYQWRLMRDDALIKSKKIFNRQNAIAVMDQYDATATLLHGDPIEIMGHLTITFPEKRRMYFYRLDTGVIHVSGDKLLDFVAYDREHPEDQNYYIEYVGLVQRPQKTVPVQELQVQPVPSKRRAKRAVTAKPARSADVVDTDTEAPRRSTRKSERAIQYMDEQAEDIIGKKTRQ